MIMDRLAELCDATALSQLATGRAVVGNTYDIGSPTRDIGAGKTLYLVLSVDTTVLAAGGASTVSFEVVSDAQDPILADGSATIHVATKAFPKAELVAGWKMLIPLPSINPEYERFLGIIQNVATNALTAGKINAFLTLDPHGWRAYPEGVN